MSVLLRRLTVCLLALPALIPLEAATVSRQSADECDQKIALIQRQGDIADGTGTRRTPFTEDELNSWLLYRAPPLLPDALGKPQVTIIGEGRLAGQAVVDLNVVGTRRSAGSRFNPFRLLGGKVEVSVTGILHASDGMGRFEVQSAQMSGIPVPVAVLQELVSYFSRTPERPEGARLDDPFSLPASIRGIEVGQGQAVVVQ